MKDLNEKIAEKIFIEFKNNKLPDVGSQIGRKTSEPLQNRKTLLKMLKDKDRIFTNLYGDYGNDLKSSFEEVTGKEQKKYYLKKKVG